MTNELGNLFKDFISENFSEFWPTELSYQVTGLYLFLFLSSFRVEKYKRHHRRPRAAN